jgi:hypothetical protein
VNEYYEYFGPDYKLDVKASNTEDLNSQRYLDRVRNMISENLRSLGGPPSVQMQGNSPSCTSLRLSTYLPLDIPAVPAIDALMGDPNEDEDLIPPDTRRVTRLLDALVQPEGELSDSDDEGEGKRRNHASARDEDETMGPDVGTGTGTESAPTASERAVSEADSRVAGSVDGEGVVVTASTRVPTGILIPGGAHGPGPVATEIAVRASGTNPSAEASLSAMDVDASGTAGAADADAPADERQV